ALLLLAFGLRLYQVRELALPAWVDSVHHALLVRVAIEQGGAPLSLLPYLPVEQLPYHWGYHVLSAASAQIAQVGLPEAMLWQGQALNALHVLACAALAARLWRSPWAGLIAGLVVGTFSIMPAYYASWGRYTQLTGLLLLPPLAICWGALLATRRPRHAVEVALLLAGLNLVHFRVLILALALLAVQMLLYLLQPFFHREEREEREGKFFLSYSVFSRSALILPICAAAGAMLLTAPWLWLLVQRRLAPIAAGTQSLASGDAYGALSLGLLWAGHNRTLFALALLGALWGLGRRSSPALALVLWAGTMLTLANPQLLTYLLPLAAAPLAVSMITRGRPLLALLAVPLLLCNPLLITLNSSWLITNDIVVISLFVPASALIGYLAVQAGAALQVRLPARLAALGPRPLAAAAVFATLALAAWGAYDMREVINTDTVLAFESDRAALAWIDNNTPADARFLIGAAPWLSTGRGVDGGWWITPLTGRWMSTPPVLYDFGAAPYVAETAARNRAVIDAAASGRADEIEALIVRDRISHIYLSSRSGALASIFADRSRYPALYTQGDVTILAVRP
ncbi:MAG: hypothetical protein H7Z42_18610, partial [Roseiflexaceae bacterium]|nr:hypothetical protein [Roseiflexaceae bacterium]